MIRQPKKIREQLWYEILFGIEERWDSVKQDIQLIKDDNNICYLTGPNEIKYCVGRFEHVSVSELNTREVPASGATTTIEAVVGDVVKFINDPANNGAVFQVASQFNCLEFINPAITPEAGVDRYEYDHTQGPACSIACGPATVYRNYFVDMPITPEYSTPQVGQTAGRQLDGFDDIARDLCTGVRFPEDSLFKQQNGYLTATEDQLDRFYKTLGDLKSKKGWNTELDVENNLWSKLKIGVHYDVEVTSSGWGKNVSKTPNQRITQVFCSGAAIGYSRNINRKKWEPLARAILEATYDGTLNVATRNSTKKVFLTFIGGGVFQNSMTWIADAILKAATKYKDSGLKIYLVCFGGVSPAISKIVRDFK